MSPTYCLIAHASI